MDESQHELEFGPLPTAEDLQRMASDLLDDLVARFPLGSPPRLLWKPYRVAAGKAYLRENAIGLSRILVTTADRLADTLRHEYAHLLAVHRHGFAAAGHGPAWKEAMRDLAAQPEVYHRYPVRRNARRQRVVYACATCGARFETHRRFPRGRRYVHRGCGGTLRFVRVERLSG